MTPLVLGLLAVALAGPVPSALARVPALRRTPVAAMVLWQALALAAVLAALGAGLSLVTTHVWRTAPSLGAVVVAAVAGAVTLVVLVRLLLSGHRVGTQLRELRRRHRAQVDLLSRREGGGPGEGYRVIDHEIPVAYCLPGVRGARIVVSAGAAEHLDAEQLAAVLAHERAHLRHRHDLVLEAFTVLHRAFPVFVSSRAALAQVQLLAEILADRAAVEAVGPRALCEALLAMAGGRAPQGAMGAGASDLAARVEAIGDRAQRPAQTVAVLAAALALLLLPTLLVVTPWLASLLG